MSAYYVLPPQEVHQGIFIVSTDGCGFERHISEAVKYKLVSVLVRRTKSDKLVYTLVFEYAGVLYECCRTFKYIDGAPAVRVDGRLMKSPDALRPFADKRTKITPH